MVYRTWKVPMILSSNFCLEDFCWQFFFNIDTHWYHYLMYVADKNLDRIKSGAKSINTKRIWLVHFDCHLDIFNPMMQCNIINLYLGWQKILRLNETVSKITSLIYFLRQELRGRGALCVGGDSSLWWIKKANFLICRELRFMECLHPLTWKLIW